MQWRRNCNPAGYFYEVHPYRPVLFVPIRTDDQEDWRCTYLDGQSKAVLFVLPANLSEEDARAAVQAAWRLSK